MAHDINNEKDGSDMYTIIKVVRDEDLYQQIGRDVYFGLVHHLKVPCFQIHNSTPFSDFLEIVPKQFFVPLHFPRFWMWSMHGDETHRPKRPLTSLEESQSVGQLERVKTKSQNPYVILFMEVSEPIRRDKILHPQQREDDNILLFFKLYDSQKEDVRYVGKLFVKGYETPRDIREVLNEMANFDPNVELLLYKETWFMCHRLNDHTFHDNMLENGDIIWFQKASTVTKKCRYPDVPSFLSHIHHSQSQALDAARSAVSNEKDELKKAEATVMRLKDKLKELEGDVVALEAKFYL